MFKLEQSTDYSARPPVVIWSSPPVAKSAWCLFGHWNHHGWRDLMWKLSIISTKSLFVSLSTCPEKRDTSSPLLSLRQPWGCRSDLYIWEGGGTCQTVHYQQGYWGKVSSFATNCLIDTKGYCLADRPAKLLQGLRLFLKQIASYAKSNRQRLKKAPCTQTVFSDKYLSF